MSLWPSVRLSECCEIVGGATPSTSEPSHWGGGVHWATPKDLSELNGSYLDSTPRTLTESGLASCSASVLPLRSVLFSSRAPIGLVAINRVPVATNQGFKSFVPDTSLVHAEYLLHWLRTHRPMLESLGNGATFKEVSKAVVSRVKMPLPPLPEQRRIAEVLDRAEALRAQRRQALAQLDALAESIFLDMFGDPVSNPKGWPRKPMGAIGHVVTGNTPSRANAEYYGDAIEWIKSDNLNTPQDHATRATEYLSAQGREVGRVAPPGSILVTCIAGSPECIGNAAIVEREVAFNQQINALIPAEGCLDFWFAQLTVGKRLVQAASTDGMKGMVSKSRFERIELIVPPEPLQELFAVRRKAVAQLKSLQTSALAEADALFASLQHRAFRGEL